MNCFLYGDVSVAKLVRALCNLKPMLLQVRILNEAFIILEAFFQNFLNLKLIYLIFANIRKQETFTTKKVRFSKFYRYIAYSRAPACSKWKLSLKISFLWSNFLWYKGRGFESQTFLVFFKPFLSSKILKNSFLYRFLT